MSYVTLDEFKQAITIADTVDDADLQRALNAATAWIDHYCGRTFNSVDTSASVRYFLPYEIDRLSVPDLSSVSALDVDSNGDLTFSGVLEPDEYGLYPLNVGQPGVIGGYTEIRLRPNSSHAFILGQQIRVTALWGYGSTPAAVQQACILLANRYFHRPSAPFGTWESAQTGQLSDLVDRDPDVAQLLGPYVSSAGASRGAEWVLV